MSKDLKTICRCCLRPGVLKSMFSGNKTTKSVYYYEMIKYCCELSVTENDGLPSNICTKCITKLKSSYKFKQKCLVSNMKLLNLIVKTLKQEKDNLEIEKLNEVSECNDGIHCNQDEIFVFETNKNINNCFDQLIDITPEIKVEDTCYENYEIAGTETSLKSDVSDLNNDGTELPEEAKGESDDYRDSKTKKHSPKLKCEICGQYFLKISNLQKHVNWIHYGIKAYHCTICNKDFMNEKQHRETHEKSFSATCDQCGKTYSSQQNYKYHMKSHGNEEYICECGLTFKVKAFLRSHIRTVHAPKKFMCHFCSKAFTMQGYLVLHLRVHTGEKPFECQLCHQRFRRKLMLNRHIQGIHSDVRSFHCQQCHKQFKTKTVLTKHMVVHAETRRFVCRVCQKPFGRVDNRNVHERSVHSLSREQVKLMWPS